jgi:hypothetical protein
MPPAALIYSAANLAPCTLETPKVDKLPERQVTTPTLISALADELRKSEKLTTKVAHANLAHI